MKAFSLSVLALLFVIATLALVGCSAPEPTPYFLVASPAAPACKTQQFQEGSGCILLDCNKKAMKICGDYSIMQIR